jgi:hypothetical protein
MLLGTRRSFCALSVALIEVRMAWPPGGDLGGDLVEMKREEGDTGSAFCGHTAPNRWVDWVR